MFKSSHVVVSFSVTVQEFIRGTTSGKKLWLWQVVLAYELQTTVWGAGSLPLPGPVQILDRGEVGTNNTLWRTAGSLKSVPVVFSCRSKPDCDGRIVWIITQPKMVREVELHNLTLEDGPTGVVLPEGIYVGSPLQVWWETGPLEPAWLSGKFSTQQFLSTEWFEMVQVSISSQSWTVTAQAGWS